MLQIMFVRLSLLLALFFINSIYVVAQHSTTSRDRPPNIILIMADDLGYETLGCNGGKSYSTPHLDKMAADGVRFTHCYSLPLCTPSRVQLMTGKYGFRNYKKFGELDKNEKTFGNLLRDKGYATCIVGKWQLGGDESTPSHFGFDEYLLWQLFLNGRGLRYRNPTLIENGSVKKYTNKEYGPDLFYEYAADFISRNKTKPFFLYYPMALTHDPFQPVPGGQDYAKAPDNVNDTTYFKDMVGYMDKIVGKIIAKLDDLGLAEETMIIFTGDNGTSQKIYSNFESSTIKGNKGYPTTAGTHVPLIVKWKRNISTQTNENLIDFTDFYVTLAEAAGIRNVNATFLDGTSFLGQLFQRKGASIRNVVFGDYNGIDKGFIATRYAHNKSLKVYETGEIYQIDIDPEEKNILLTQNLSPEARKMVGELKAVIARMQRK
jgi:arylsulfatase A